MSTSVQPALASEIAAELRATFSKLKRRVREQGGANDLTASQIAVVHRLERYGAATVSSLARAEGMRPQSMSAIVAPLQQAGLVSGAPDPGDGRQTLISLTPKCVRWIQKGRAARQDWLTATITQKLSMQEQQKLQAAMRLLTRLVED